MRVEIGVRGDRKSQIKAALFQEHLCEEEKGNLANVFSGPQLAKILYLSGITK